MVNAWVKRATDRSLGRYDVASIIDGLMAEKYQLWLIWDEELKKPKGCAVTQILIYPTGLKALDLIIVTGRHRKDWVHLMADLEQFGRNEGCGINQAMARPGWEKELPDYNKSHVLLEKVL